MKPTVRAKRKPSPRLRHHSRIHVVPANWPSFDVADIHPPVQVYDPNKTFAEARRAHDGASSFRPVYIHDSQNKTLLYVGDGDKHAAFAAYLVRLINMDSLKGRKP